MPIGITVVFFAILVGGFIGAACCRWIPESIKGLLPSIFGGCAIALGAVYVVKVANLPPIILALILGTIIGQTFNIEDKLISLSKKLQIKLTGESGEIDGQIIERFVVLLVLFSASSTVIMGSFYEGMTGDTTILITKAILDFFTALIFSTTIGYLVMLISIPTLLVGLTSFFLGKLLLPHISSAMAADFVAGGGILIIFIGLHMMDIKKLPVSNMTPAIILFLPFSYLWLLIF